METLVFVCPVTGRPVQGLVPEEESTDPDSFRRRGRRGRVIRAPAALADTSLPHVVQPSTGARANSSR
jgi:hypothetical protein